MRYVVLVLLLLGGQFTLTVFAPAERKAWFLWPFSNASRPIVGFIGGLPKQGGSAISPILGGIAGLCFLAAAVGLLWSGIPATWWPALVGVAAVASAILFVIFFTVRMVPPIIVDAILLYGMFFIHWTVAALKRRQTHNRRGGELRFRGLPNNSVMPIRRAGASGRVPGLPACATIRDSLPASARAA